MGVLGRVLLDCRLINEGSIKGRRTPPRQNQSRVNCVHSCQLSFGANPQGKCNTYYSLLLEEVLMCVSLSSLLRFNSKYFQVLYYFTIFEIFSFRCCKIYTLVLFIYFLFLKKAASLLLLYFKSTPSFRSVLVRKLVNCEVTENPFSYVYLKLSNLEIE